jgi:hypothetical protein
MAVRQRQVPQAPAEHAGPVGLVTDVVADVDRDDLADQVAVHLVEAHQFGQQPPERLRAGIGLQKQHLGAGVVQHGGGHRPPFGLIAVQQTGRRPPVDRRRQFPPQVDRILDPQVQPLAADRRVDVRRVAGQQRPADPVAVGQPGRVPEPGQPARRVHPEVGAGHGPELGAELVQCRRHRSVLGHRGGRYDHPEVPVAQRSEAEPQLGAPHLRDHGRHGLRILRDRHLAQQGVHPGRLPRESDAEQPADRAPAAVAADDEPALDPGPVGQADDDSPVVLLEPHHLEPAPDLRADLPRMLGEQPVDDGLRDTQHVPVRGVQPIGPLGERAGDAGEEAAEGKPAAVRQEPLQQAALVEDLDAAHMQAQRPDDRCGLDLVVQQQHVHAVQP